jgi:hypothetical protein
MRVRAAPRCKLFFAAAQAWDGADVSQMEKAANAASRDQRCIAATERIFGTKEIDI